MTQLIKRSTWRWTPLSILALAATLVPLVACHGGTREPTCDEAIDHMASLSVDKRGSALPDDQRARHHKVLARAIKRQRQADCSNNDRTLIVCVLEARDPATAKSCWRNK